MKYTKGPWRIEGRLIKASKTKTVCEVPQYGFRQSKADEANAQLIAAAPELFEALEAAYKLFDEALPKFNWGASALDGNAIQLLNQVPRKVEAAIAKAKGTP